uniref:Uncharacterized protein n=1 Tax=Chlorocebus sabaeus TaxID=60711 RepID=A0A0D9S6P4_CHLSB
SSGNEQCPGALSERLDSECRLFSLEIYMPQRGSREPIFCQLSTFACQLQHQEA